MNEYAKIKQKPGPFYKWELLILLFFAHFFYQADRAIFGIVTEEIGSDLHLSDTQLGLTASVLFFVLAIMVPAAGFIGDRFSRKWIITICILFWSLSTCLTGLATGLISLILFRSVATAGTESFYGPSSTALIASFHKKTRAAALSIHQSALYIGVMITGFLAGWMAENYGWRSTFYVFGGLGIVIGLIFIRRLKDASECRGEQNEKRIDADQISETVQKDLCSGHTLQNACSADRSIEEEKEIRKEEEKFSVVQTVHELAKIPTVWLLTAGFVAIVFVNNAYLTWATALLSEKCHLSTTAAGGNSMFYHHLGALIFILIGGIVSDIMVRRFISFRVHLQWLTMLCGAPAIWLLGNSSELTTILLMMFLFGAMRGLYESNTHAAIFEVVPVRYRASLVGLMIMSAFLIGSTSPYFMGVLQDRYGKAEGLSIGFSCLAAAWVLGGLAVMAAAFLTYKRDRIKNS